MKADSGEGKILVSACLLGINCRYDGDNALNDTLVRNGKVDYIPVCPEQLGGLSTPREPCEIIGGGGAGALEGRAKVLGRETGTDFTRNYLRGAEETLKIARTFGCCRAIFKAHSPSCGKGYIRRGGKLVEGDGVTSALLLKNGIEIESM